MQSSPQVACKRPLLLSSLLQGSPGFSLPGEPPCMCLILKSKQNKDETSKMLCGCDVCVFASQSAPGPHLRSPPTPHWPAGFSY